MADGGRQPALHKTAGGRPGFVLLKSVGNTCHLACIEQGIINQLPCGALLVNTEYV